jgi:hypothetical protein
MCHKYTLPTQWASVTQVAKREVARLTLCSTQMLWQFCDIVPMV